MAITTMLSGVINASGDFYQIAGGVGGVGGVSNNYGGGGSAGSSTKKLEDGSEKLKDIVAFLGLKIINVIINDDVIALTCRRNRKVYKIQIKNSVVTIINDKDKIVRQFNLFNPYYTTLPFSPATPNTQPIISPYYFSGVDTNTK